MLESRWNRDYMPVAIIAAVISINAFLYFSVHGQTYVHIDAIAHVNKARGLVDNFELGLRNLGTVWLPLPHLLAAPLAAIDVLWRTGAAGSLISVFCFIGTSLFLFQTGSAWTGSRIVGWVAFMLFALNPRLIYFFTTPENEPLTIFCATGLIYYLVRWTQDEQWRDLALAGVFVFAGTWTRYEGWALAVAACLAVAIVTRQRRVVATILFTGAAVLGPMLWMLFNRIYFDDPLMFAYGIGSAQSDKTGKTFGTAGNLLESVMRYFIDVAYSLNPGVLWLGVGGVAFALLLLRSWNWRPTLVMLAASGSFFSYYVLNLYTGSVSILLPGIVREDLQSTLNVRYGTVMAATIPLFAGLFVFAIWRQVERRRVAALLMLSPLVLGDPIPAASHESIQQQFTQNLFYNEGVHNQSFWMPPFVQVSQKLDDKGLIMTNTRIVHVVVWATGIPMRRFVTEMNEDVWGVSLHDIDPRIRWAMTEEGDQLWNGQGKWLAKNWIEVATAKGIVTGTVHLYRRPD
jgi:Dolichyl-phosphate-mannose-protein mannosyltransferase